MTSYQILAVCYGIAVVLLLGMTYANYKLGKLLNLATKTLQEAGDEIKALNRENDLYLAELQMVKSK